MKLDINNYDMIETKKIKSHGKFVPRDVSWLDFNKRVLGCSLKKDIPFNERMNFLGITESNLDEFIGVRFSNSFNNQDIEPYKELLKGIKKFIKYQNETFQILSKELKSKNNIVFTTPNKLNKKEKDKLKEVYEDTIFPLITPIDVSDGKYNITSGMVYISVIVKRNNTDRLVIIPLLNTISRLYQIGDNLLLLEDIIIYFMKNSLFINQEISSTTVFKIIKDSSIILSHDESRFIVDRMIDTLNKRNTSNSLFLELRENTTEDMENLLSAIFKIPNNHIIDNKIIIDYKIFMKEKILGVKNNYKEFDPFQYENYENHYNIFDAINSEDILLHHPYDSYDTVVKFIQHSAIDPNVEVIRQTLYRVSSINSPIVNALCDAARNGKSVVVLVEIKARFDEDNNIKVIEKLKRNGVKVVLGEEYLKTHCKMCIVVRREKDKIRIYSHVGTGNYNEKTGRLYTDLSYFTSKQKIGRDLLTIFSILTGNSKPDESLNKVFYAPVNLRKQLEKCIDREISNIKKNGKGEIFIKVNSLSDIRMVNKLYEAADNGVKIKIICRGACSIIPRKNIEVKSIVGRFLEHSRIYYFKNNKNPEYYISSADLLTRNLDRRVETLISLTESNVVNDIKWIMEVLNADQVNSNILNEKGKWVRVRGGFDSHQWFINHSDEKKRKKKWKK